MQFSRRLIPLASLLLAVSVAGGGALYAQLEGADRGVPPIDSASTLEVTGVDVDVSAKTSEEARYQGWKEAQSEGWKALWAKTTGQPIAQAPGLSDPVLNSIVSGIIIEQEQIGPTRYIARLGVLFDRARAGQLLGVGPLAGRRSAPMLVIPVFLTGSSVQTF
ncbi:MAG TPA: heavy-metal-associated domain-containing protein, partial [Allosphingosinicella sp.]